MASFHRLTPLDTTLNLRLNSSPCASRLVRHSSLPNLFLGDEPELLSFKAPCMGSTFSYNFSSPQALRCKLPLCRALSNDGFDGLPYFNTAATHTGHPFTRPIDICIGELPVYGLRKSPEKESLLAVGRQMSLDLEQSIVYTELKESMWKFEAPPRCLRPHEPEACPSLAMDTHMHAHIHEPVKNPNLCMESSQVGAKGRPLSLRMLKRKLSQQGVAQADRNMNPCMHGNRSKWLDQKRPSQAESIGDSKPQIYSEACDSVSSAFTSLFYILKMLQQYTHSLRIRSQPSIFASERSCYENLTGRACADMLESFLWMFQQVFSCNPDLMLLTMVLLADFTLHSLSLHVAFPVQKSGECPTQLHFPVSSKESVIREAVSADTYTTYHAVGPEERGRAWLVPSKNGEERLHGTHSEADENGRHARQVYGERDVKDPHVSVSLSRLKWGKFSSGLEETAFHMPMKMLVAPVRAPTLEADDYPCFDRTDLAYQHEIGRDPRNPLLLANYAQFLHLVRHDYARAEQLYRRAMNVEAEVDGDVVGRFASFLWVAKGDVAEADKAFKAATAADPTNAFHAGNYAHFLWNSSAGQA